MEVNTTNSFPTVTINKVQEVPQSWGKFLSETPYKVYQAVKNTGTLIWNFPGDINGIHKFMDDYHSKQPIEDRTVYELFFASPSLSEPIKKVMVVVDPLILKEIRKIPRGEVVSKEYLEEHAAQPCINGGRPFGAALKAIKMGILSEKQVVHDPFLFKMKSVLGIHTIENAKFEGESKEFKERYTKVAKEEVAHIMKQIEDSIVEDKEISLDFGFLNLKIWLRAFFPDLLIEGDKIPEDEEKKYVKFDDKRIRELLKTITEVSDWAFQAIMNPLINTDELAKRAEQKLNVYFDDLLKLDQSFYLGKEYVSSTDPEILKEILVSLLFAGADNIKKYLDHVMVEFGNEEIRQKWLNDKLTDQEIKNYITEVIRLYTVIYAQPGVVSEPFDVEVEGRTYHFSKGADIHYNTKLANRNEKRWGADANIFNPTEHKKYFESLNAEATFGGGHRRCEGKYVTKALGYYVISQILRKYGWSTRVDDQPNYHPTELNFNNGVKGNITYKFWKLRFRWIASN